MLAVVETEVEAGRLTGARAVTREGSVTAAPSTLTAATLWADRGADDELGRDVTVGVALEGMDGRVEVDG